MTTAEVLAATGVTRRQLQHWVERGLIPGQQVPMARAAELRSKAYFRYQASGIPRSWTDEQVERVREIKAAVDEAERILASVGLRRSM